MNYTVSLILLSVFLTSCQWRQDIDQHQILNSSSSVPQSTYENYTNADRKFSLAYPSEWTIEETTNDQGFVIYFTSPTALQNNSNMPRIILVAANGHIDESIPPDALLDAFEQAITQPLYKSQIHLKIIDSSDTTVAGVPARRVIFSTVDYKGDTVKAVVKTFQIHGRVYSITLYVLENNPENAEEEFNRMLASLKFDN